MKSNVNEVISAVLNSSFLIYIYFFLQKILSAPKTPKASKAQKCNQAQAQNATSEKKLKNVLKKI